MYLNDYCDVLLHMIVILSHMKKVIFLETYMVTWKTCISFPIIFGDLECH